jgi:hypothetical protein
LRLSNIITKSFPHPIVRAELSLGMTARPSFNLAVREEIDLTGSSDFDSSNPKLGKVTSSSSSSSSSKSGSYQINKYYKLLSEIRRKKRKDTSLM